MRFFHISDLHLGKRVHEFSMLEDQRHILGEILRLAEEQRPDAVLIAGDVYDKSVPSAEAMALFDDFLFELTAVCAVLTAAGNHDSSERLSFGRRLYKKGLHIAPAYGGSVERVTLSDDIGEVDFYLLPYIKPSSVRRFFPEKELPDSNAAVAAVISSMDVCGERRSVLLAHQFVTGSVRSDSEESMLGGLDNVEAAVFSPFDYTALGHLHRPQDVIEGKIRYCGSPLQYSFSEAGNNNSVTMVELGEKGEVKYKLLPLSPLRRMTELKGGYYELFGSGGFASEDYMHITLTDEDFIPMAAARLRKAYPNLMKLDYDNSRTRRQQRDEQPGRPRREAPLELFREFYRQQNNAPMREEQLEYLLGLMEEMEENQ